ncbi:MAG: hypothetical protein ACJ760_03535 [Thermoleophilaceae bacterium]
MTGGVQTAARAIAAGRVLIGAALLASPDLAAQWAGADARRPGGRLVTRALGARDAALGAGTLLSGGDPARLRVWLAVSGAVDAADFAVTLAGPQTPGRGPVLVIAATAAVTCLAAAAGAE